MNLRAGRSEGGDGRLHHVRDIREKAPRLIHAGTRSRTCRLRLSSPCHSIRVTPVPIQIFTVATGIKDNGLSVITVVYSPERVNPGTPLEEQWSDFHCHESNKRSIYLFKDRLDANPYFDVAASLGALSLHV